MSMQHLITWRDPACQHKVLCRFRDQLVTLSEIPGHSAYGPLNGGIHSYGMGRQGTPQTMHSPNGRLPIQTRRHLGARVGQECTGGRGCYMMRYSLSPRPPTETSFITIGISIKMEAREVKAANTPCASALPCVIPSENVNEIKERKAK